MKNFILFLCKTFKVRLVEPNEQILHQLWVHEKVPYTLVQSTAKLNKYDIPQGELENAIQVAKKHIAYKCIEELETSDILTFTQFEEPMSGDINIKCFFYAAPHNYNQ
jgi:hypothetical protein